MDTGQSIQLVPHLEAFMPAKDLYHDTVCAALIKEGWTITDDPLMLKMIIQWKP